MINLTSLTISEISAGLRNKKFLAKELTKAYYDEISRKNKELNAYVTLCEDEAYRRAEEVDRKIKNNEELPSLAGVPYSAKDVFLTKGIRTTACSKILENYIAPTDAVVEERLKKSGAILLGKTNTDEFTCGASTETSCFGVTRNPHDLDYVAGGSSGGSAAAVAANLCCFSIGTDTGGSIRLPASYCGITGLKVTYGRVPRTGVISMASSWDTIGPLTKNVADAAKVLQVIAGRSDLDATTPPREVPDYSKNISKSLKGVKVGIPKEFFIEGMDNDVEAKIRAAIKVLEKEGAKIVEVTLPAIKYAVACYYVLIPSEVSANMARYDGIRYGLKLSKEPKDLEEQYRLVRNQGFGEEMKRRILMGTYALSAGYYDAYYLKAQKVRTKIIENFDEAFLKCDVIVGPVAPTPAFRVGEKAKDPLSMYIVDLLTIPASAAGLPALSIPCGKAKNGLPIGFQLISPQFSEDFLLNVGNVCESALLRDKLQ